MQGVALRSGWPEQEVSSAGKVELGQELRGHNLQFCDPVRCRGCRPWGVAHYRGRRRSEGTGLG